MNKQPLYATIIALALGGCGAGNPAPEVAQADPHADRPYVPSSLYSEFKTAGEHTSEYSAFLSATQAQQDEKYTLSADYYLKALRADPESRFVADRAFFQLLYGGQVEQAAVLAEKMLADGLAQDDDLILLMAILKAYLSGDYQTSLDRIQGLQGGFSFLISPIATAWCYAALDDVERAVEALRPLVEDQRLKLIAEEQIAYILDYSKRFDEAKAAYKALTETRGASLQPVVAYSYMLYRTGKAKEGRMFLSEQLKIRGNNTYLLREGARISKGKAPSEIIATPNGALGMVFFRLSSEFSQSNTTDPAVLYGRIASYLLPKSADVFYLLGSILEEGENPEAAAAAYNRVPLESGLRGLADIRRIEVLRRGGYIDVAEGLIKNFLKKRPDDIGMLIALADIAQQRESYEESITYYDEAINQIASPKGTDWYMYFARAVSYERLGNWARAERDLKTALEISPDQPGVLNYLGYSWIDRGEHVEKAKAMIEKAAAARPDDGFITDSLGWVHFLIGEYEDAVRVLETAVKLEPDDVTINDHLGDAYWRVGRKIEARFQWRHAIDSGAEGEELAKIQDKIDNGLPELAPKE